MFGRFMYGTRWSATDGGAPRSGLGLLPAGAPDFVRAYRPALLTDSDKVVHPSAPVGVLHLRRASPRVVDRRNGLLRGGRRSLPETARLLSRSTKLRRRSGVRRSACRSGLPRL